MEEIYKWLIESMRSETVQPFSTPYFVLDKETEEEFASWLTV